MIECERVGRTGMPGLTDEGVCSQMTARGRRGLALLVFGVLTCVANRVAMSVFERQWGGPNVGGGALLLLSVALAGFGLVMVISELMLGK